MEKIKIISIEGCEQCRMIELILNKKKLVYEMNVISRDNAPKDVDYPIVNYNGHIFDYGGFLRFLRENKRDG